MVKKKRSHFHPDKPHQLEIKQACQCVNLKGTQWNKSAFLCSTYFPHEHCVLIRVFEVSLAHIQAGDKHPTQHWLRVLNSRWHQKGRHDMTPLWDWYCVKGEVNEYVNLALWLSYKLLQCIFHLFGAPQEKNSRWIQRQKTDLPAFYLDFRPNSQRLLHINTPCRRSPWLSSTLKNMIGQLQYNKLSCWWHNIEDSLTLDFNESYATWSQAPVGVRKLKITSLWSSS